MLNPHKSSAPAFSTGFLLFLMVFMLISIGNISAQIKSCCNTHSLDQFAMLGADADFQAAHMDPLPFNFVPAKGKMITFPVKDGKEGNAFLIKTGSESDKYLFVIHEWWGLNDYIKKESEKYADNFPDVNIIAIDLYDGQIAANKDEASKIMQTIKKERAEAIINGALAYVGTDAKIQSIGWCFGGGWSLQTALLAGKQSKGCVMYYGPPEDNASRLATLNGPVLGIFASKDGWINKPMIDAFELQMRELNKSLTVHWFDADHAFANPSNPQYDAAATAKARELAIRFLKDNYAK